MRGILVTNKVHPWTQKNKPMPADYLCPLCHRHHHSESWCAPPAAKEKPLSPSDATNGSALPVPRDRGRKGWKTKVSLCESIVKKVTFKSGTKLYAETVDDVIQELESRGYLKYEQNAKEHTTPTAPKP